MGEATLLPYCLGAERGKRAFNIANDAFASSLYPFNTAYQNFTKATYLGQMRMGDSHAAARVVDVDVVALDDLCGPGGESPAPDYLSIDVEGAEFDILQGVVRTLQDSVVWLRSEMWAHPVYEGAATMETSMGFLKQVGFELFKIEPYGEYEAERMTIGMHGVGQTLGAEVDFYRSTNGFTLASRNSSDEALLKLYKLALMAFLKGGNGLGYRALKQAETNGGTFFAAENGDRPAKYLDFLAEVWVVFENMNKHLPSFPDLSPIVHQRRQQTYDYEHAQDRNGRDAILRSIRASRREVEQKLHPKMEWEHKLKWMTVSPLESVFRKFGLAEQASAIEQNRNKHCENFIRLFYSLGEGPLR